MASLKLVQDYLTLCKPKVVFLMLVTTWVGMSLASTQGIDATLLAYTTLGIASAAGSAAVINHLLDRHIDCKMARTKARPIASGRISPFKALVFSTLLAGVSVLILLIFVNPLTTVLTLVTLFGYAIFYTLYLKRATPQNIVIGGAAGAMPPLLGWTAVTGEISPYAWLLVLIIFTWTPSHFWALAIYRHEDYKKAKIPMLPVTHGIPFTKLCIVLYTILLMVVSILPYLTGMSGLFYCVCAVALSGYFLVKAISLYYTKSSFAAFGLFKYSIVYLFLLFGVLLFDHLLK